MLPEEIAIRTDFDNSKVCATIVIGEITVVRFDAAHNNATAIFKQLQLIRPIWLRAPDCFLPEKIAVEVYFNNPNIQQSVKPMKKLGFIQKKFKSLSLLAKFIFHQVIFW